MNTDRPAHSDRVEEVFIHQLQSNATPPDKYKLEVERTSSGKYRVEVRVTANDADELIDRALGILDETKSRLGIQD